MFVSCPLLLLAYLWTVVCLNKCLAFSCTTEDSMKEDDKLERNPDIVGVVEIISRVVKPKSPIPKPKAYTNTSTQRHTTREAF